MPDTKLPALTTISAPALDDLLYIVDVSDTTDDATGSSRDITVERLLACGLHAVCQGRLTTESGVGVSTSDRTSQSTIYFTPFNGNRIAIYDGTRWGFYAFTERSLALSGLTSGKNYDVFLYNNSGTLTLELSAAWTNDTTRADALTTQDGVLVKSGTTTRRYLGTIRTTSTTATEDSATKRFVWNAYNQVNRPLRKTDSTASWTYATSGWRSANNSATNRVEIVTGLSSFVDIEVIGLSASTASVGGFVAIGEDSTSSPASECLGLWGIGYAASVLVQHRSNLQKVPTIGYHYYQWLEGVDVSLTLTFYGTESTGLPRYRCGIFGVLNG